MNTRRFTAEETSVDLKEEKSSACQWSAGLNTNSSIQLLLGDQMNEPRSFCLLSNEFLPHWNGQSQQSLTSEQEVVYCNTNLRVWPEFRLWGEQDERERPSSGKDWTLQVCSGSLCCFYNTSTAANCHHASGYTDLNKCELVVECN